MRLIYDALRSWRGTKPLWIRHYACRYKVEVYPAEIRARIRKLSSEQIEYVCRSYAAYKGEIRHSTTWLQSALFFAAERMEQASLAAAAGGEIHPQTSPPQAPQPQRQAPQKPRNSFHFEAERLYAAEDYASLEAAILSRQKIEMFGFLAEHSPAPPQGIAADTMPPLRC